MDGGRTWLPAAAVVMGTVLALRATAGAETVAVVVGVSSPIAAVTLEDLREVFLKRRRIWADGARALPVNLPADHPIRLAFSRRVLGRSPTELEGHWSRLWFEGVRPPPVLQSPQAVCAYVAVEPAAIGYIAADAVDATACRVILRMDIDSPPP